MFHLCVRFIAEEDGNETEFNAGELTEKPRCGYDQMERGYFFSLPTCEMFVPEQRLVMYRIIWSPTDG